MATFAMGSLQIAGDDTTTIIMLEKPLAMQSFLLSPVPINIEAMIVILLLYLALPKHF